MANPYQFDRNVDEDIFEEEKSSTSSPQASTPNGHKHTIDGSICPTCSRVHNFMGVNLSPQQQEELLSALDQVPGKIAAEFLSWNDNARHHSSNLAYTFLHYNHIASTTAYDIPILTSLMEVIDQMTGGQATRMWRIMNVERELVAAHSTLKELNNRLTAEHSRVDDEKFRENEEAMKMHFQTVHVLDFLCDLMGDRITSLVKKYRGQCRNAEVDPKDEVITSGTFPEDGTHDLIQVMMQKIRVASAKVFATD